MTIQVLDSSVVHHIAAGEVVERPASVVKELIENSLDAGATTLEVVLKAGGTQHIRVVDDGIGLTRSDAGLAIARHATSKLRTEADLSQIRTLGFRGEALPSMASVSRFSLTTRPADQEVGTTVRVDGGKHLTTEPAGCAAGTQVIVDDLFYNVPARRKFLRTVSTELGHSIDAITRQLLLRPQVDLTVTHAGRQLLRAPRTTDPLRRLRDLLGSAAQTLMPLAFAQGELSVQAWLSPPGIHQASSQHAAMIYVNERFVRDTLIRRAVHEAYRSLVPTGRFPMVVLALTLPPGHVDVNVHPTKAEVRFDDPGALVQAVSDGIRQGLKQHGVQRSVLENPPSKGSKQESLLPETTFPAHPGDDPRLDGLPQPCRAPSTPAPTAPEPYPTPIPPDAGPNVPYDQGPLWGVDASVLLAGEAPPPPWIHTVRFQDLAPIGLFDGRYLLCEGASRLVIIDVPAARECLAVATLRTGYNQGTPATQALAEPVVVELSRTRRERLQRQLPLWEGLGFRLEPFGPSAWAVHQIPNPLARTELPLVIHDLIDSLPDRAEGPPDSASSTRALWIIASHAVAGDPEQLTPAAQRQLLTSLDGLDPALLAEGRRVSVHLSVTELEQRFDST